MKAHVVRWKCFSLTPVLVITLLIFTMTGIVLLAAAPAAAQDMYSSAGLRSRGAYRRLRGHIEEADVLEWPCIFPFRPRRHHEHLFDGFRRAQRQRAHAAKGYLTSSPPRTPMGALSISAGRTFGSWT
jgi:hypothetical protein